ncbi:MAG: hypothetical protein WDZ70_02170 [Candidatus Paceibacterota bacterium]
MKEFGLVLLAIFAIWGLFATWRKLYPQSLNRVTNVSSPATWITLGIGGITAVIMILNLTPFQQAKATDQMMFTGIIILAICGGFLATNNHRGFQAAGKAMKALTAFAFAVLLIVTVYETWWQDPTDASMDAAFQGEIAAVSSEAEAQSLYEKVLCNSDYNDKVLAAWMDHAPLDVAYRQNLRARALEMRAKECPSEDRVQRVRVNPTYNPFEKGRGVPHLWATQDTVKHAWLIGETRLGASEKNKELIQISHCGDPNNFTSLGEFIEERKKKDTVTCAVPYFSVYSSTGDSLLFIAED